MEEFRRKYGLSASDREGLMEEIKQKIAKLHPDKNGGEFRSDEEKEIYMELSKAKEELDNIFLASNQLVPISVVKELITLMGEKKSISDQDVLEEKLKTSISRYNDKSKRKSFLPRVSSAAIAVIVSFVWLFPGTVKDHPVLSRWIDFDNMVFTIVWFYILFLAIAFWVRDYIRQNKREELSSILQEEQFQNELFHRFLIAQGSSIRKNFTKSDFINFLTSRELEESEKYHTLHNKKTGKSLFPHKLISRGYGLLRRIDRELASNVTDIVFSRAVANGVIRQSDKKALSVVYELSEYE